MKKNPHHLLTGILAVLTIGMSGLWIWQLSKVNSQEEFSWDQLPAMSRSSLAAIKPGPEGDAQVQQHLLRLVYGTRATVDWRTLTGPARVAWIAYTGHDKLEQLGLERYTAVLTLQPTLPSTSEIEEMYRDIGDDQLATKFHEAILKNDPSALANIFNEESENFKIIRCTYLNEHAKELAK